MTPAEYLSDIVLPTVDEFMVATGDRQRGYLACITVAHVPDYLARAGYGRLHQVRQQIASRGDWFADCVAIVTGICNGSKHAGPDRENPFQFAAGSERRMPAFAFDVDGAGLDEARWDRPGLVVGHRGFEFFVDDCVSGMLHGLKAEFADAFEGVEVSAAIQNAGNFAGFQRQRP